MSNNKKDVEELLNIVAHDLGAPFRHIKQFSTLLLSSLGDKVDDKELEYVDHIKNSIIRAEGLIAGLSQYSRVLSEEENLEETDLNEILERALRCFNTEGFHLKTENLPTKIRVQKNKIEQLFKQLLENSIKFAAPDRKLEIQVSAEKKDNHWLFRFEDNGRGIAPQYIETIFRIFARGPIQPEDEIKGIGVGLAIAKKIVDDHQGTINVINTDHQGLQIEFTLENG